MSVSASGEVKYFKIKEEFRCHDQSGGYKMLCLPNLEQIPKNSFGRYGYSNVLRKTM
jgi:hypothetical protein